MPWIVGAFVLTATIAALYFTAQNLSRSEADDAGQRLASQVTSGDAPTGRVDLETNLAPFYVVYDEKGAPVSGTGYLDGKLAVAPAGVIAAARQDRNHRVTWEPRPGLRFATVETSDGKQVVLAGQSLRPSESRIERLGLLMAIGWAVSMLLLAGGALLHLRAGRDFDS